MVKYVMGFIPERLRKYRYPALILALGLLLLLLPTGRSRETGTAAETPETADTAEDFDLAAFTREAEDLLSDIQGAGRVRLLLTLEDGGSRDYLSDRARDGDLEAVVVTRDGSQYPVTVVKTYPRFRGAVVVCSGSGPGVTLRLKEALSCLTGLGMDRITVLQSA